MATVKIGNRDVGDGKPSYVIAEIGINHNGDLDIAKKLISLAHAAGCDAVKFQKRTVDVVYTAAELATPRENPFGPTNGDLKRGLEFGKEAYDAIDAYCKEVKMPWFASCWDEASVDFIDQYNPPCYKIASASLTDDNLLKHTRAKGKPIIMSTGMSTMEQVEHAVDVLGKKDLILLHTCSTYPSKYSELNLRVMKTLRDKFGVPIGYSGHESGLAPSVAAVAIGACAIERHITIDRAMWGSDQAASVGPSGLTQLVRDIRLVETAMGSPEKQLIPTEVPIAKKLRRVGG
jgi:N-acetylneuraminate synthase